jgi:6-pyruvoyltetrahydropterin/6-carboxytetrahydropterin synthase
VRAGWSDAENRRVFGKAVNLHGHNYVLEVTVEGQPSPDTGMVIDLKVLKDIIAEVVLDRLDHKNLNVDLPEFAERLPTPEHVAVLIWELLAPRLTGCRLQRVRLQQDETLAVDYLGERAHD